MENKNLLRLVWVGLILYMIIRILFTLQDYMLSIQGALIASIITYPIYKKLLKKTGRPSLSAVALIIGLFLIVLIPLTGLGFSLINQAAEFDGLSEDQINTAESMLSSIGIDFDIQEEGSMLLQKLRDAIFSNMINLLGRATDYLINIFIFFFLVYYLLIFGPQVVIFSKRYLPFSKTTNDEFLKESKQIVYAVFFGAVLTAFIQGFLGGIGFFMFGLPKALLWGFVMVVLSILPVIGSWLVWGPGALYLIAIGNLWAGVGLIIWGLIVVSQSDNVLKPIITSKLGNVHPVVILLGVIAGVLLFGIIGLISGPIIFGILVLMIQKFHDEKNIVIQKGSKRKRLF